MNGYLDLVEHYQNVLEKRNEWTFRVQSTFFSCSLRYVRGNRIFKQFFHGQHLQQDSPCHCCFIGYIMYPFLKYFPIRE